MKTFGFLLLALALSLFAACGGEDSGTEPRSSPTALRSLLETPTASVTTRKPLGAAGDDLYGSFVIPPGQLATAMEAATKVERPILEDGVISFSEYERLTFAALACLEEGGLAPMHYPSISRTDGAQPGPLLTSRGEYIFFAQATPGQAYADGRRVWDECTKVAPTVEFYWTAIKTEPTEAERQAHRDSIAACLRNSGHDAPEHPSKHDLAMVAFPPDGVIAELNEPDWFEACHYPANDEFAIYSVWHGN